MDTAFPAQLLREQIFASPNVPLLAQRHILTGTYERHSHDFLEFVFIVGGTGQHVTLYGEQPLGANNLVVIRPGIWHAYQACANLEVYNCCFALDVFDQPLAWLRQYPQAADLLWGEGAGRAPLTITQVQASIMPRCLQQLEQIHSLIAADAQHQEAPLQLIGHLLILLGTVVAGLATSTQQPSRRHQAVQEGMKLLAEQLAFPWTLADLACRLHIDAAYLVRLFTAQVGCAPMQWLAQRRVDRAATLLTQTELPIAQIGAEVGWPDANHFARRFRGITGMSASAYRASSPQGAIHTDITHQ